MICRANLPRNFFQKVLITALRLYVQRLSLVAKHCGFCPRHLIRAGPKIINTYQKYHR